MAEDVEEFIGLHHLQSAAVIGHSMLVSIEFVLAQIEADNGGSKGARR